MSQSEALMLVVLGFALACFLALLVGRVAWKIALRQGAKRSQRSIPSTVAELQTDRDRLRAEHAMMAKKLEIRVDDMKMRVAEQAAEVSRHRNRVDLLTQDLEKRESLVAERDNEILMLRDQARMLEDELALQAEQLRAHGTREKPAFKQAAVSAIATEPATPDRLKSRIKELTSISDQISKQREVKEPLSSEQFANTVFVKPANSTVIQVITQTENLETKIEEVEKATNNLQEELQRLDEVWVDKPAEETPVTDPPKPKRGITNVISLAQRIKTLQKKVTS